MKDKKGRMDMERADYLEVLHNAIRDLKQAAEDTAEKAHNLPAGRERDMLVHQWALRQGEVSGIKMAITYHETIKGKVSA